MIQVKSKTKQGAAAIYTVIFFCILIGIITLSFVSIMMQDILLSTNYDLSQSAYDAALAGVEDAKIMLIEYENCVSDSKRLVTRPEMTGSACDKIISVVNAKDASENCDLVREALGRTAGENETIIQSEKRSAAREAANIAAEIDMAYTCVKVDVDAEDYIGKFSKSTSDMKVIPLRGRYATKSDTNPDINTDTMVNINRVEIKWYTSEDDNTYKKIASSFANMAATKSFTSSKTKITNISNNSFRNVATLPPVMRVNFIQAGKSFTLSSFERSNGEKTNRGELLLRPVASATATKNYISNSSYGNGFAASAVSGSRVASDIMNIDANPTTSKDYESSSSTLSGAINSPVDVSCLASGAMLAEDYACVTYIDIPEPYSGQLDNGSRFLILSMPYASPDVSFSVRLMSCKSLSSNDCSYVPFVGVQSKIDSTGRANDIFRRVESRVELVDNQFPFPKYGLNIYGDSQSALNKNFWATKNCWTMLNGTVKPCDNQVVDDVDNWAFN